MRVSFVLLACLSCVLALPPYILPFNRGRAVNWVRRVLDCPPFLYGSYDSRCREEEEKRAAQRVPHLTVLELVEEVEPSHVRVVHDKHAGTFAIKVPHKFKIDKPRCSPYEIYVSELDICVEAEGHTVKSKVTDGKWVAEKQKENKEKPVTVVDAGSYEKEKCGPGEIWVPEVSTCLDRNPPPPLEPEEWPTKPER